MKTYKNTKTGAIINSPCTIQGGDWILYTEETEVEEIQAEETEEVIDEEIEVEETEVDSGILKKDIIQELDALGIEYDKKATRDELFKLMKESR